MRKKKPRRPRRDIGWPYLSGDLRIEDAGPPPKGPIIGRHRPVRVASAAPDETEPSPDNASPA